MNQPEMATIDEIFALHQCKWSIRRIAKELGIHRDTVARQIQAWPSTVKAAVDRPSAPRQPISAQGRVHEHASRKSK